MINKLTEGNLKVNESFNVAHATAHHQLGGKFSTGKLGSLKSNASLQKFIVAVDSFNSFNLGSMPDSQMTPAFRKSNKSSKSVISHHES